MLWCFALSTSDLSNNQHSLQRWGLLVCTWWCAVCESWASEAVPQQRTTVSVLLIQQGQWTERGLPRKSIRLMLDVWEWLSSPWTQALGPQASPFVQNHCQKKKQNNRDPQGRMLPNITRTVALCSVWLSFVKNASSCISTGSWISADSSGVVEIGWV